MRSMLDGLVKSQNLAWTLFVRDFKSQYRQSVFGVLWAFVPPIVTALIFIVLQKSNAVNLGDTGMPYPVYVLVGTVLWQVFVDAFNAPLRSVKASQSMLVRINFPREALIVSGIYLVLFNLIPKAIVVVVVLVLFRMPFTWGMLLAPVLVLMLVLLGVGIGLLLAPIGMLYTDISAALPVITQIWFFLTPVVYVPPQTFPYSLLGRLNPVTPLLVGARDLITAGTLTDVWGVVVTSALAVILVLLGWIIYRISMPIIIERLSA